MWQKIKEQTDVKHRLFMGKKNLVSWGSGIWVFFPPTLENRRGMAIALRSSLQSFPMYPVCIQLPQPVSANLRTDSKKFSLEAIVQVYNEERCDAFTH